MDELADPEDLAKHVIEGVEHRRRFRANQGAVDVEEQEGFGADLAPDWLAQGNFSHALASDRLPYDRHWPVYIWYRPFTIYFRQVSMLVGDKVTLRGIRREDLSRLW